MMRRQFAMAVVAIALASGLSAGTQAEDIALPCDAFMKNADGSWTPVRDVPISGMGRKLVLRQGGELRPGATILSVDFAALLEQQCPSVSVSVPDSSPTSVPGSAPAAESKIELSKYADALGNIDVQKLTCGQFASTSQEDADFLGALYIGWYNGSAKKTAINVTRVKEVIRDLIVHCRANKNKRVTQAIDFIRNQDQR
jgi:hypothetical protein